MADFDHAAFISDPNKWPNWPALPVKRYLNTEMQIGYLWGDPQPDKIEVFKGNIWTVSPADPVLAVYGSAQEMVADGWKVD